MREQIISINQKLLDAQQAYYGDAQPIMTDAEYDALEAQLRGLVKANPQFAALAPVLTKVGSSKPNGKRIKHVRPMLSIENKYAKDELRQFFVSIGADCNEEPKRDGISCDLKYDDGILVRALTRGTDDGGEDMTAQVKACKSIPQVIDIQKYNLPAHLHFRGELVMRNSELARINAELRAAGEEEYSSTRNLAAGTMKKQDLSVVASREILFQPWDMFSPDEDEKLPDSNYQRMLMTGLLGFLPYEGFLVTSEQEVVKVLDAVLEMNAKSDIRADGVVIKVDSHKLRKQLGVGSKFTNYMCCFKPQAEAEETTLREVIWQVGRTGKVTPVAICDPVMLAGAKVERANLNNLTWIENLGLTLGARVKMLRSGDVIPQISEVLSKTDTPIVAPTNCPVCDSKLKIAALDMDIAPGIKVPVCENNECPGRAGTFFAFIAKREILEIDGLGEQLSQKLVDEEYARNVAELFQFQKDALAKLNKYGDEKFAENVAGLGFSVTLIKVIRSMETSKAATWDRWIAALGIPMFSRSLGKVLAKQLKLQPEDMKDLPEKFLEAVKAGIEGCGPVKTGILRDWASDPTNRQICATLYDCGVRPTATAKPVDPNVGEPLKGVSFCISGTFSIDRDVLADKLVALGAVKKSSVSKNCTHFIVGELPGGGKLKQFNDTIAKGFKVEKVGKEWLEKVLGLTPSVVEVEEA